MKMLTALAVALLAGCAGLPDGVRMTDEERAACAAAPSGCSVWTEQELQGLAAQAFMLGVQRAQSRGRGAL